MCNSSHNSSGIKENVLQQLLYKYFKYGPTTSAGGT